jgi:hypothetical protein
MKRAEKVAKGMSIAATEYRQEFRKAGISIENRLEHARKDFDLFVVGWLPAIELKEYLARVRADAREYAGYAVAAARA